MGGAPFWRERVLIGLLSDSHIPEAAPDMWPQVYESFKAVDLILHAGDLHVIDVVDKLERLAPIYVARGNGDDGGAGRPVVAEDPRLRDSWILELEGFKIGMTHAFELPEWPPYRTFERMLEYSFGGPVDIVVCGHTHVTMVQNYKGVLILNPGSPMYPRNMNTSLGNIGFMTLERGRAHAWIEQLR
jgi:putative phosphoesterase